MIVDGYTLEKVLNKIRKLGIKTPDSIRIFTVKNNRFPDDIILRNTVRLITNVIKDCDKFYPHLFSEKSLYDE